MSTLRISNIEAKADSSSPTVDEQLRFTNSDGDLMLYLDGRTAGITTVGINTTNSTIKFDANNNILITGIVTATEFHGTLAVGTSVTYGDNEKAYFGTGLDLSIYHNGSHSYIEDTGTGSLYIDSNQLYLRNNDTSNVLLYTTSGGEVRINHNGTTKLTTTSTGVTVTGTLIADGLTVYDNEKLTLGNNTDIEIFHNGTNNIFQSDTGDLQINSGNSAGNVEINVNNNVAGNTRETSAKFIKNGAVELYHNNVKKFETTSAAADFTVASNGQVNLYGLGGTNGLRISGPQAASSAFLFFNTNHQNVSGGTDQYTIQCGGANHTLMFKHGNNTGNVVFELDDTEHVRIPQDSKALKIGASQDFQFTHDGSTNIINGLYHPIELRHGSEVHIKCVDDGAVELYHNGSMKLDTRSSGVGIGGDLFFVDSSRIYMGSSNDFLFFHDGANSHIVNATGNLVYRSDTHHFKDKDNGDTHAKFIHDGAVELYNDNSRKLRTYSDGVKIASDANTGRLVLEDTSGNYCYQLTGYNVTSAGAGGRATFQDSTGAVVLDMRASGGRIYSYNHFQPSTDSSLDLGTNGTRWRTAYLDTLNVSANGNNTNGTVANFRGGVYNQINIAHANNSGWGLLLTNTDQSTYGNNTGYHFSSNTSINSPCAVVNVNSDALHFATGNTSRWYITHGGNFLPFSNHQVDIGSSGARVRDTYGTSLNLESTSACLLYTSPSPRDP